MKLYRDDGVVLRTMRLGEADRIVTILTRSSGKVRAVAKGVRKTTSRFGGRLEPLTHVSLQLWKGRELDIVTQAEVIDAFAAIRSDLSRLSKAWEMAEVADQISQEGKPDARLYEMLTRALGVLDRDDPPLVVAGFMLKVLAVEGSKPVLGECASCGSGADLVAFDMSEGGALCRSCRRGRPISSGALEVMRRALGGRLGEVLAVKRGPLAQEVTEVATEAMEAYLDRRLRSARTGIVH